VPKFRSQLFRAKRRNGKLYPKWRIKYFRDGVYLFAEVGYTDKGRTEEKAKEALRGLEHQDHMQAIGAVQVTPKPVLELLPLYLEPLARKGGKNNHPASPLHVTLTRGKLVWWFKVLRATYPQDIRLADIEAVKMDRAASTVDLYIGALRAFLNWCVKGEYLGKNVLRGYQKHAPAPTFTRRALTAEEIGRLLAAAPDRYAMIYLLALITGMRRRELDSLKVSDVDWKAGKISLAAPFAKNRKAAEFFLPDDFLPVLYAHVAGKRMTDSLLGGISESHAATTLARHLQKADVVVETHEGRVDFHSLRVTFLTLANELGEDVKTVQDLARHADPRMTFGIYAKTRQHRLRSLITRLHASIPKTNQDIPRLGMSHAGVTQGFAGVENGAFGLEIATGRIAPRASGRLEDMPSHHETLPDIEAAKARGRAAFLTATKPAIPSHSETEEQSRRRNTLIGQIAESLAHLPESELSTLLSAIQGLNQKAVG
jgi:integrase